VCASCATGCNIVIGSREDRIYRYTPRRNDAVNSCWMCDAGRLNYRWIGRPDRLVKCGTRDAGREIIDADWPAALRQASERLRSAAPGSAAIVASARQTNEELYLLRLLAAKLEALTDSVPRVGAPDRLLVSADRNPNSSGARLMGLCGTEMGINLPRIADGISRGAIRTLIVFGEDVTRRGIGLELMTRLETLVVSDVLPNATTAAAHVLLPGCAPAEKRGTFVNAKGRLQRFWKAVEPPGEARPEVEFLAELVAAVTGRPLPGTFEGLFSQMAQDVPAFDRVMWSSLGDAGVDVKW
jgi:NADH-quinone oxidoreductase subunit G